MALLLSSGLVGTLISLAVQRSLDAARDREQRFRELLSMSADWYRKLDEELRFVHFQPAGGTDLDAAANEHLGLRPWEMPTSASTRRRWTPCVPISNHARPSVSSPDAPHRRARPAAHHQLQRPAALLGEQAFRGFWGVGRDITAEMSAQNAMLASETRLPRTVRALADAAGAAPRGTVLDANPAAAAMCGFADPADMAGFDLLSMYRANPRAPENWRAGPNSTRSTPAKACRSRTSSLQAPSGQGLSVQATAVRVMADAGPATLSIFFDVTARRAAEAALQRSRRCCRTCSRPARAASR